MALPKAFKFGLGVLGFWPFVPIAARAPLYGRLLLDLVRDDRVPRSRKVVLGFAAAYVASPIDLIPDFVPFISRLDDLAVVLVCLDLFLDGVPRELMIEKMHEHGIDGRELERDLESMRRYLPRPIRMAIRRLPRAFDRGSAFVRAELARYRPARIGATSRPTEDQPA